MIKIMKLDDFGNSIFYRAACACGDSDHYLTIELGIDDFCLTLNLYGKLENCVYWGNLNWFQRQWKRIKGSLKYFFCGWIECEEEFMFINEEHIQSFIDALVEGKKLMKERIK